MNLNELIDLACHKAGKRETLAAILDLAPSTFSKKCNSEIGWSLKEINMLLEYAGCEIIFTREHTQKIEALQKEYFSNMKTLKEAFRLLLNSDNTANEQSIIAGD